MTFRDYVGLILPMSLEEWLFRGKAGISSMTIASAVQGVKMHDWADHDVPHDPDDFSRCYILVKSVPCVRRSLSKVAEMYPYWKPFIDHWHELEALFEAEMDQPRAPKTYERMRQLREEAYEIRDEVRRVTR